MLKQISALRCVSQYETSKLPRLPHATSSLTQIVIHPYYLLLENTRATAVRITTAAFSISFFVCPDETDIRRSG